MNYRGNTPETVSGESWLYSLNGATDGSGGGGGGDTPGGSSVSFSTNADAQTWAADTDGTYGGGFATTTQGLKIGYYKHTSTSNPVAPNANHIRVYKNSALSIDRRVARRSRRSSSAAHRMPEPRRIVSIWWDWKAALLRRPTKVR